MIPEEVVTVLNRGSIGDAGVRVVKSDNDSLLFYYADETEPFAALYWDYMGPGVHLRPYGQPEQRDRVDFDGDGIWVFIERPTE